MFTSLRIALGAALIATVHDMASAPSAAADSPVQSADYVTSGDNGRAINQVTYTTGAAGRKLKWLPNRPDRAAGAEPEALVAEYTVPVETPSASKPKSQGSDPFVDPFGDSKTDAAAPQPAKRLNDKLLEGMTLKPIPVPSLPQLTAEQKPAASKQTEGEAPQVPSIEELVKAPGVKEESDCPAEGTAYFKAIKDIGIDIRPKDKMLPPECTLSRGNYQPRAWAPVTFTWTASALCHKPLYFEEVQLERYGHAFGPVVQPVVSAAHFFATIPILPYEMGICPPCECVYSLGYYRPGSCAPYILDGLPLSVRGGLYEAAAITGAVFLIP